MKKLLIILSLLLSFSYSSIEAITKDGKSVILKPDGTWGYIDSNKDIDTEDFGIWEIAYYVDEFGEHN